ncbi:MAG: FAD-dependent oxidoreductase [Lachnospiraceae bacterium]|nr:FAD-dependent oxidoreductase [Lachnospiraceae bacterium]
MIRINQLKISLSKLYSIDKSLISDIGKIIDTDILKEKISKCIKTSNFSIERLVKISLDARDKENLCYIITVDITSSDEKYILSKNINNNNIMSTKNEKYKLPKYNLNNKNILRPIIIGSGPAGYFAGLYLARMGFKPVIYERGKCVEERIKDVESFWNGGTINSESNVSFGEGGAGTFSDGKLGTNNKDKTGRIKAVIDDFIGFGAPTDIGFLAKPHIGTNELRSVMHNMREEIFRLGGDVFFEERFTGYSYINDDTLDVEITLNNDNSIKHVKTNALILAIGHSARDTFKMLSNTDINMEQKAFAIGLRIEHKKELINKAQYGDSDISKLLAAADYKMTYHSGDGRGVYSFCMCPGGFVVNASSDDEQSVVNGMSNHARDEENSNSAIVCTVTPEDFINEGFGDYGVLAGCEFQKKYERLSYVEGKGKIPVQLLKDYRDNKPSDSLGSMKPNIKGGYTLGNLNNCLPQYVNNAIIEAIFNYDKKLKGFGSEEACLSGIESRTSSPIRILRDDSLMSNMTGIFPCGEGAGYAGGITSAAVDGIKVAEAVAEYLAGKK